MLFLLFSIGEKRFALEARAIVEILPLVDVRSFVRNVAGVAGVIEYRNRFIPVVDLSEAAIGRAAARLLSTRIVIARHAGDGGGERLIGLIAEGATELVRIEPSAFEQTEIISNDPYVGAMANGQHGVVQRVHVGQLVPSSLPASSLMAAAP
jgi:chemotaxis-related protein WspB